MKKILVSIVFLLTLVPGFGAIILSDSFNYGLNTPTVGASGSPWANHSGTAGTSLIWTNQLRVTFSGSEDINAPLFGAPYTTNDPGALFASFTLQCYQFPSLAGGYIAHFRGTNTGAATDFGARLWVSATNTAVTNSYRLGIGNGTSADASSGQFARDLASNEVVKVVIRFTPSTGEATLWLDPSNESDPSVTAIDTGTATRPNPFNVYTFAFRQGAGHGAHLIDDLKVGTTFNDVAGPDSPPSISSIPAQRIPASSSTPALPFVVTDDVTPATSLTLGKNSSNPGLLPLAGIVFGGSGSNRTVTVTPTPGLEGAGTVFVSVTDGSGQSTTNAFTVTVGAPTISTIADQITRVNVGVSNLVFTIGDAETPGSLTVTPVSGNQLLVPDSNIQLGGTGTNRTITITPLPGLTGVSTISLTVSDGNNSTTQSFVFQVAPVLGQFFSDRFDRPNEPVVNGEGIWFSHSGLFAEMQVVSNRVQLTGAQTEDVNAPFPAPNLSFASDSGALLYASFSVQVQQLPTNAGNYFAHFKDDGTANFRGRVFARTNTAAAGKYRLGVANLSGTVNAEFPADLETNVAYRCVLEYNTATVRSRLWVEPVDEGSPSASATDPAGTITTSSFALRQSGEIGTLFVDNLRLGGSFADVAPYLRVQTTPVTNNVLRLSWPAGGSLQLQAATSITAPVWTNVPNLVTTNAGLSLVTVTNIGGSNYYRLIAP